MCLAALPRATLSQSKGTSAPGAWLQQLPAVDTYKNHLNRKAYNAVSSYDFPATSNLRLKDFLKWK